MAWTEGIRMRMSARDHLTWLVCTFFLDVFDVLPRSSKIHVFCCCLTLESFWPLQLQAGSAATLQDLLNGRSVEIPSSPRSPMTGDVARCLQNDQELTISSPCAVPQDHKRLQELPCPAQARGHCAVQVVLCAKQKLEIRECEVVSYLFSILGLNCSLPSLLSCSAGKVDSGSDLMPQEVRPAFSCGPLFVFMAFLFTSHIPNPRNLISGWCCRRKKVWPSNPWQMNGWWNTILQVLPLLLQNQKRTQICRGC